MADRPMIFSPPMVRALIEGRKTQTRRLTKPNIYAHVNSRFSQLQAIHEGHGWRIYGSEPASNVFKVPYAVGDRLWVRERAHIDGGDISYAADCVPSRDLTGLGYRPSIHMPRWASRLTLYVTDVRVQRLQDISEDEALAEGLRPAPGGWWSGAEGQAGAAPRAAYALLWNSLHSADAWDANPWVCAISFAVHRGNIDSMPATYSQIEELAHG